jgi:hypothetical protein
MVTHAFGREEVQQAYDYAMRPARGRYKVVVDLGLKSGRLPHRLSTTADPCPKRPWLAVMPTRAFST